MLGHLASGRIDRCQIRKIVVDRLSHFEFDVGSERRSGQGRLPVLINVGNRALQASEVLAIVEIRVTSVEDGDAN
jgi:hypothetical protein